MSGEQHDQKIPQCDPVSSGRCKALNSVPESQKEAFFGTGQFSLAKSRTSSSQSAAPGKFLTDWFVFWKKGDDSATNRSTNEKRGRGAISPVLAEGNSMTDDGKEQITATTRTEELYLHQEEDRAKTNEKKRDKTHLEGTIKDALETMLLFSPLKIASPFVNLFRKKEDDVKPPPIRAVRGSGLHRSNGLRMSAVLVEAVVLQPTHQQSPLHTFWHNMYRTIMVDCCGMALVQDSVHWIANVATFVWMLLPTTVVWNMLKRVSGYFSRLWKAFWSIFALPKKFRHPFKEWREYIVQDVVGGTRGGNEMSRWAAAIGLSFASFAYYGNENYQRINRKRRMKRRRA